MTSGTATLETALFEVPQVVCYKGERFSFLLGKWLVDVKFISLVNLIMDKTIVQELIQDQFNVDNLAESVKRLLFNNEYLRTLLSDYKELKSKLGGAGASEKAAKLMFKYLNS